MARYKSYEEKDKPLHCLAQCVECGKTGEKRYMQALMLRKDGWAAPRVIAHICNDCSVCVFDRLGISKEGE